MGMAVSRQGDLNTGMRARLQDQCPLAPKLSSCMTAHMRLAKRMHVTHPGTPELTATNPTNSTWSCRDHFTASIRVTLRFIKGNQQVKENRKDGIQVA
jgi:hypothetical protein